MPTVRNARGGAICLAVYSNHCKSQTFSPAAETQVAPLCRARLECGRPSATYASHSCHSCVRVCVYVCMCVDCCSNWDIVSPVTIAEEGEQPAHFPAHRVMTQR